jgi:hypothetical protein
MGRSTKITERRLVHRATPLVFGALRLPQEECRFVYELTVGASIADLVILRAKRVHLWPEAPLSIAESSVYSALRRLGTAHVDTIAKSIYMRVEAVRKILLGRLASWLLVRGKKDGSFRATTSWVDSSDVVAIEAKLTRWREALAQATTYRRYADRVFVLLPMESAKIAVEHKDIFLEHGVGLLSYDSSGVYRMFSCPRAREHTWHREFALSRIR